MSSLIEELMKRYDRDDSQLSEESVHAVDLHTNEQPPSDPEGALLWMNDRHFVVSEEGKTLAMKEAIDPELDRRVLHRSTFDDIRRLYSHLTVVTGVDSKGQPTTERLGHFWLQHQRRRQYIGMVCAPGREINGYYNLWKGFSVPPTQGDWSLMDRHIRDVIAGGNENVYRYVRHWMAFAVQHPETLPGVALVMRGKEGTGKGVFARGFGSLFGQHFLHLATKRALVGNFNAHLRDAIIVFADEAFLANDKEAEGVLKAMITEREMMIERKYQNAGPARNMIHLIVASNNDRIVTASAEARRFCVLDVSDRHMQDRDYFKAILDHMDKGGASAMLYDLLHEDLSGFDPAKFPITAALQDQKVQSMTAPERWWFNKLQRGRLLLELQGWPTEVLRDDLVNNYRSDTRKLDSTAQDVRHVLEKLLPDGFTSSGSRVTVGDERKRTWRLPPLEVCRERFEDQFGLLDPWAE